jgi:hypothetical protein
VADGARGVWVNEENGGRGGEAYRACVGDAIKNQVAATEMDGGAEAPRGYGAGVDANSMELLKQAAKLLERVGAGEITGGGGGSDIVCPHGARLTAARLAGGGGCRIASSSIPAGRQRRQDAIRLDKPNRGRAIPAV